MAQTTPARPGAVEPPTTGRSRAGSLLGQWDSAVTSYYVLTGATALLIVLGLVMVLSSSSVESLAANESPYAVFVTQAQFALIGVPVMFVASRMPQRFYTRIAWPALAVAAVLQLLTLTPLGLSAGGNRGWIGFGYDGIHAFTPEGERMGHIMLPETTSNLVFGGPKRNRLMITASQSIYAIYVNTRGAHIT